MDGQKDGHADGLMVSLQESTKHNADLERS